MISHQQLPMQFQPRRQDRLDTFVPGDNQALLTLLEDLPRQRQATVFLHGGSGCGKTHLLNAVCSLAQEQGRSAIYLPLARLNEAAPEQLDGVENTALVCLDDLDAAVGNRAWEEALFHMFNRVMGKQGNLLVTAQVAPAALAIELNDLKSRLGWGHVLRIQPLAESQRRVVLQNYARRQGFEVPANVLNYFFSRSRRSLSELLTAMDLLGQAAFSKKRAITVPLAREVLLEYWTGDADPPVSNAEQQSREPPC